ncbi:hypothetical protein NECAME_09178 [Necator americanus]|uniref:Glutaredoxin domain-containing protein n=1 Tax=Necator americanus TaxID=51031 RepID=W2TF42_NECAM|nr:hypothetical protein NECAME_09178 [Necator americanus]ETN80448.1 hypothetical protein NECAME_09178 [Necator americanus]
MLSWIAATLLIFPMVNGQAVNVTIFTESQCPYCTKLLREQIWPFYVNRPGIMNLQDGGTPYVNARNLDQISFTYHQQRLLTPLKQLAAEFAAISCASW